MTIIHYSPPYVIFLTITIVLYITSIALSFAAVAGGNYAFPDSQIKISNAYEIEITPTGATLYIWCVIFVYQLAWMVYEVINVKRRGDNIIQSNKTLVFFNLYTASMIAWLFLWSRGMMGGGLITIVLAQYFINIAFGYACADLHGRIKKIGWDRVNKIDVWYHRILIQNGILSNATWITFVSLLNMSIVLHSYLRVASATASLVSLAILGVALVIWFVLENVVLDSFTEYTFTSYIVVIGGLVGILQNVSLTGEKYGIAKLTTGLIVIAAILLLIRIVILIIYFRKGSVKKDDEEMLITRVPRTRRKKYNNIYSTEKSSQYSGTDF